MVTGEGEANTWTGAALHVTGVVSGGTTVTGTVDRSVVAGRMPWYEGQYEVEPTADGESLPTAGRSMARDMAILPIPYGAVENNAGGVTVSIAS